ncbi:MAG: YbaN family protein [Rubellimicrobium sp.]|nr:YbaN family protein [Rubellimicrobium sp.]
MARQLWLALGVVALVVGIIGIAVPLLPTTPLLLLAALSFGRSSPRLARWLLRHPRLGPPIRDWRAHGVIRPGAKRLVLLAVALSLGGSAALGIRWWALAVQAVILGLVLAFVLTRPGTPARRP